MAALEISFPMELCDILQTTVRDNAGKSRHLLEFSADVLDTVGQTTHQSCKLTSTCWKNGMVKLNLVGLSQDTLEDAAITGRLAIHMKSIDLVTPQNKKCSLDTDKQTPIKKKAEAKCPEQSLSDAVMTPVRRSSRRKSVAIEIKPDITMSNGAEEKERSIKPINAEEMPLNSSSSTKNSPVSKNSVNQTLEDEQQDDDDHAPDLPEDLSGEEEMLELTVKKEEVDDSFNDHDYVPSEPHTTSKASKRRKQGSDIYNKDRIHTPGKTQAYKCSPCNKVFGSLKLFKRHLNRKKHNPQENNVCKHCGRKYTFKHDLDKHEKEHMEGPFSCHICCKAFTFRMQLSRHIRVAHYRIESKTPPCKYCSENFQELAALLKHVNQTHMKEKGIGPYVRMLTKKLDALKCKICHVQFLSKRSLYAHATTHAPDDVHKCDICAMIYKNKKGLEAHIEQVHDIKDELGPGHRARYQCKDCDQIYRTKWDYNKHLNSLKHKPQESYSCNFCGKQYTVKKFLQVHEKQHIEGPFKCSICSAEFLFKPRLKRHMKLSHTSRKSHRPPCKYCHKHFPVMKDVLDHVQQAHMTEQDVAEYVQILTDKIAGFKCKTCQKQFQSIRGLYSHEKLHEQTRKLLCHVCSQKFSNKYTLAKHVKNVHYKEKPFLCHLCPAAFNQNHTLKVHIQSVHHKIRKIDTHKRECEYGKRRVTCKTCWQQFPTRDALKKHSQSSPHMFHCLYCGMFYYQESMVIKHVTSLHVRVEHLACTHCDGEFDSGVDLIMHLRDVHDDKMSELPHSTTGNLSCTMCPETFENVQHLYEHVMSTHSDIFTFNCTECSLKFENSAALNLHSKTVGHDKMTASHRNDMTTLQAESDKEQITAEITDFSIELAEDETAVMDSKPVSPSSSVAENVTNSNFDKKETVDMVTESIPASVTYAFETNPEQAIETYRAVNEIAVSDQESVVLVPSADGDNFANEIMEIIIEEGSSVDVQSGDSQVRHIYILKQ